MITAKLEGEREHVSMNIYSHDATKTSGYDEGSTRTTPQRRCHFIASLWDDVAPSPTPVRPSVRSSSSSTLSNEEGYSVFASSRTFQNKKYYGVGKNWEDHLLLRSGVVRGTNVQTEFDEEEEEKKVNLRVHDIKRPPFLDGRIIFTEQAKPIMPVKDLTSDMAIISQEVDADSAVVDEDSEVDFKGESRFLQYVSDFTESKTLPQKRQCLPIFSVRDELLQVVRENQVVVIIGETGSGKTTQITQYLYEEESVRKWKLNLERVGYAIRFEDITGSSTVIKYMTDGVLLREALKDPDLEKYSIILMDEAHERSLNTDVLFGILKKVVTGRFDFRLTVTSATLYGQKFSNFFGSVPIFHIPGRSFPVQIVYSKTPCEDYVEAAVKQAMIIHITGAPGDILIFLTGQDEIEATCYALSERMEQLTSSTKQPVPKLLILPIYS
ncbi:hypothetical protein T459_30930 [Capsicum annuum]|uniref:RNA helicase n=1 Tax=Capsicum annuum TaxID=4072 RepID=A0A2G2Y9R4_CAPAN|nr:hypothetical protein T459_30930 [Capsicum annuum]